MSDLYDDDILLWSEHEAALLRRLASGEHVNDRDLDWPNISEEIEAVGRSELRACGALLVQAVHPCGSGSIWRVSSAGHCNGCRQ
jgi:hypothetical protein